ncbi:FecR family protein [Myxococcota bacterium]|nr:FecR family protein [Myxococcota bacterium]
MIDHTNKQTTPKTSPTPVLSTLWASASLRETYDACLPSPEQEQESLAKVRRLLSQDFSPSPSTSSNTSPKRPWFRIAWASIATVGAFAFVLFLWPYLEPLEPFTLQGISPTQTQKDGSTHFQTDQSTATIASKGHWSVVVAPRSSIILQRKAARNTALQLAHGRVQVAVTPQQYESFTVHHKRWQVRVKGTHFAVSQHAHTLRIEVWTGQVEIHNASHPDHSSHPFRLNQGEGAHIDLSTSRVRRFPVPPLSLPPQQHLSWASKLSPTLCAQYALDLPAQTNLPAPLRAQILQHLLASLLFRSEPSLWLPLLEAQQRLEQDPLAQETALYLLLQRCYSTAPTRCLPLSTWYIEHFAKRGMRPFLARIHFLRADALASQPHSAKQGLLELKSFRETFPQGLDRRRACDRIKITLQHTSLPDLRSLSEEIGVKSLWFSRHCPFSK